jgi:hypothetical protein
MFGMPIRTPITIALGLVVAVWLVSSAIAAPMHAALGTAQVPSCGSASTPTAEPGRSSPSG